MKKFKLIFCGVFTASAFILHAQDNSNLVANGSFEVTHKRVHGPGEYQHADGISSANNTTVDLYSRRACTRDYSVPSNYMGTQESKTGDNYAGIIAYYKDESILGKKHKGYQRYSEYLQLELTQPLEAGKAYIVSFNASLAEKSAYAVSGLGVYFSNEQMDVKNNAFLNVVPHMITTDIIQSHEWQTISGTYVAKGGEKYLVIGGFDKYMDTLKVIPSNVNNSRKAYYYIDDVTVGPNVSSRPEMESMIGVLYGSCFELKHLHFELDKATILPESFSELNDLASFLRTYPFLVVYVDGHTDKTGTEDHNDKLSLQRADAVKDYLTSRGVDGSRLKARGYGERQPIDQTNEESLINRRVEITVCQAPMVAQ